MNKITVSIIITTYKRPKLLSKCLVSILHQNYCDYEVLIIDDNPLSVSEPIVRKYEEIFAIGDRYKYLKNPKNLGYQHSLNRGLNEAKGKYIAILDDDDVWIAKDKLKLQVEFLANNPDHVLVGTGVIQVDNNGKELQRKLFPKNDDELRDIMLGENNFAHSTVLYNKATALEVGGYVMNNKWKYYSEDEILWIKLGTKGKVANLPIYGINYLSQNRGPLYNFRYAFIPSMRQLKIINDYRNEYPNFKRAMTIKILTSLRCLLSIISDITPLINIKNLLKTKFPRSWRSIRNLRNIFFNNSLSIIRKQTD